MKNSKPLFFTIWTLIFSTQIAYANGIPAIFGVTVFHLLIINSFVIAIETGLLRRFAKSDINVWFMILANLASIFLAYILADKTISACLHTEWFGLSRKGIIEKKYFLAGVALFVVFTILIEWLFFYLAQKNNRKLLTSLKYSTVINLVTNIPIAIFYLTTNNYYEIGD